MYSLQEYLAAPLAERRKMEKAVAKLSQKESEQELKIEKIINSAEFKKLAKTYQGIFKERSASVTVTVSYYLNDIMTLSPANNTDYIDGIDFDSAEADAYESIRKTKEHKQFLLKRKALIAKLVKIAKKNKISAEELHQFIWD